MPKQKKRGSPPLPPDRKRVRMACTVAPATLALFEEIAKKDKSNVGRVLDQFAAIPVPDSAGN